MGSMLPAGHRVRAELRARRRAENMTLTAVAAKTGYSVTKLQRMETGGRGLIPDDVDTLLTLYQAPKGRREYLVKLTAQADVQPWWQAFNAWLPGAWREEIPLEDEATVIRMYNLGFIPPLLQIAAYTRALLPILHPDLTGPVLDRLVGVQATRQLILARTPQPRIHCLLDESVLRRPVGSPEIQGQQLQAVAAAVGLPNVTVQLVPFSAGTHPGVEGSLTLLEFDSAPLMARTPESVVFRDTKPVVGKAQNAWEAIKEQASSENATVNMLNRRARVLLSTTTASRYKKRPRAGVRRDQALDTQQRREPDS